MTNLRSYLYRLQFFATRGLPLAPLALALSSVSGCSAGNADDSLTEATGTMAQAVDEGDTPEEPTLTSPACSSDGISSDANVCDGAWSYYEEELDTVDVPGQCNARPACELFRNGVTATPKRSETPDEYPRILTKSCTPPPKCPPNAKKCDPPPGRCWDEDEVPRNYCNPTKRTAELRAAAIADLNTEWKKYKPKNAAEKKALDDLKAARIAEINTKVSAKAVVSSTKGTPGTTKYYTSCRFEITEVEPVKKVNDACPCTNWQDDTTKEVWGPKVLKFTAENKPKPTSKVDKRVSGVFCTTCDHEPTALKKYECLSKQQTTSIPYFASQAATARLKLLFELQGADLTTQLLAKATDSKKEEPAEIKKIKASYADEKAAAPVCHDPLGITKTCAAKGKGGDAKKTDEWLNTRLLVCESLGRPHVSPALAHQELSYCVKAYELVAGLKADACRTTYVDEVTTRLRAYMAKVVEHVGYDTGKFTNLAETLVALDNWHDALKKLPDVDANAEVDAVLVKFWDRVYDVSGARPKEVTAADWNTVVNGLWTSGLPVDIAVLDALYASEQAIDSAPLLRLTAGALRSIVDRLDEASELHDLARRYRSSNKATRTSELWAILAALPDKTELDEALKAATTLSIANQKLTNSLKLIGTSHARLVTAAGGQKAFSDALGSAEPPSDVAELVRIIQLARQRTQNYKANGRFASENAGVLHAGMQDKAQVVSGSREAMNKLNAAVSEYNKQDKSALVNALLNEARGKAGTQALADRVGILRRRIEDATKQVGGLQARELQESWRYADYASAFDSMREQGIFDEDLAAATDDLGEIPLSAANARFDNGALNVTDSAVSDFKQQLKPGEILRFDVSGSWGPSCALQKASSDDLEFDINFDSENTAGLVGPEGYMVRWGASSFTAESASIQSMREKHASVDACLQVWAGYNSPVGGAKASVTGCVGMRWSESTSSSFSGGNDQRKSASFAGGIHLKNTPFPDAPAGALLLVATAPNNPTLIKDVMVVGSRAVYVAPTDSAVTDMDEPAVDVYLVVNDLRSTGGRCAVPSDAITVEAVRVTPTGTIIKAVSQAMADTVVELEKKAPAILAQGQLLPTEETQLRSEARQRVVTKTKKPFTELPPAIQDFFETWIAAKVTSIARRATLAREERELELAVLEAASLEREYQSSQEQTEALQQLALSALRQFKDHKLDEYQQNLIAFMRDYVPPILELRYPRALASLVAAPAGAAAATSAVKELEALENFDFAAPTGEVAVKLLALATKVQIALDNASITGSEVSYPKAVLVFPKPEDFGPNGEPPVTDPSIEFRTVDVARAQQFWAALRSDSARSATFNVMPSDLYDYHGGNSRLGCHESAPVIREMGLYVSTNDGRGWGELDSRLPLQIGAELFFPTPGGIQHYTKSNTDWLNARVPVIGGDASVAFATLDQHFPDNNTGMGLSPFGTFTIDLTRFPAALEIVDDIRVLFSLEVRPSTPVVAIESCLFDE